MSIAWLADCRHGDGIITGPDLNQEHYVNWTRFFRHCANQGANSLCSIVASNYGNAGTGEDYHDQANPALDNAFIYAEWDNGQDLFGVLVQYADADLFGASPGNPGLRNGATGDGLAIAMAWREDGTSPWAGSTNDNGSDTKGATVWTPGTSIVHVLPRSNNPGPPAGSHNTSKENMAALSDDTGGFSRLTLTANNDGIVWLFSLGDNGDYSACYVGRYDVDADIATQLTEPFCMVVSSGVGMWVTGPINTYGTITGTGAREGGVVGRVADGVMQCTLGIDDGWQDTTYQPNSLRSPVAFEGGRIKVFQLENLGGGSGLAGFLPSGLLAAAFNTANHQVNAAGSLAYLASNTIASNKWVIPWPNIAAPGSGTSRTGVLSFQV